MLNNDDSPILFEKDENIALITFNRPELLNSFNTEMRDLLYELMKVIRDDSTIEAVVFSGRGRGFCAGADLTEFGTDPTIIEKRRIRLRHDVWALMTNLDIPLAVALHGFAVGSGLEIAMLCDFRFATKDTVLSLPEAKIGMVPAAGGTQSLPRLMKQGDALNFALTGKRITAEEGYRKHLITEIVAEDRLQTYTIDYMKRLVHVNAKAIEKTKSLIKSGLDMDLDDGLRKETLIIKRFYAS
ncbi:enoyl-CoA hydratase/isomerase family protein [Pueribacillus sp. YX66]|uniref:enoyl-CoA hydratase/isomerase family protein n=1 Tax=Pueribacillus sp. YX66 TaxID=3229242 RepID=UPI00358CFCD0